MLPEKATRKREMLPEKATRGRARKSERAREKEYMLTVLNYPYMYTKSVSVGSASRSPSTGWEYLVLHC